MMIKEEQEGALQTGKRWQRKWHRTNGMKRSKTLFYSTKGQQKDTLECMVLSYFYKEKHIDTNG